MCGSLARDDFHERSDIDIFVIVKERLVDDRIWWDRRSDVLQDFGRDITVLIYRRGLKKNNHMVCPEVGIGGRSGLRQGDIRGLGMTFLTGVGIQYRTGACPVAPGDGTGVGPEDLSASGGSYWGETSLSDIIG